MDGTGEGLKLRRGWERLCSIRAPRQIGKQRKECEKPGKSKEKTREKADSEQKKDS